MIPSPVPPGWLFQRTEYDRLDFWTIPLEWYLARIQARDPFALARWSDGEWPCVLGTQGANTDKHPYSLELRRDLTQVLVELQQRQPDTPSYLVGLQEMVARQHPLNERVHTWLVTHDLRLPWVSGEVFHRASIKDRLWPFIEALADRGVILVGPARLAPLATYFPLRQHVTVPLLNCHADAPRVLKEVRAALDAVGDADPPVVSFSASMSTKYLVHEIHKTHPQATLIDVGALWEPYVGVRCRRYHEAIIQRLTTQGRLGKASPPAKEAMPKTDTPTGPIVAVRPAAATIAVFTARIGPDADPLQEPVAAPGVEYFCATDQPIPPTSRWRPLQVDREQDDPVWTARRFKILLHRTVDQVAPDVDAYLWIDAAYALRVDPHVLLPAILRGDLAVLPHPHRQSIIAEAEELLRRHKPPHVSRDLLDRQIDRYLGERYPDETLSSTGLLVRRRDRRTAKFNERWWTELCAHRHTRDQMSFDYAAWKSGLGVVNLEGHYRANPYAIWHHHR
jgi:hypothetical protein